MSSRPAECRRTVLQDFGRLDIFRPESLADGADLERPTTSWLLTLCTLPVFWEAKKLSKSNCPLISAAFRRIVKVHFG